MMAVPPAATLTFKYVVPPRAQRRPPKGARLAKARAKAEAAAARRVQRAAEATRDARARALRDAARADLSPHLFSGGRGRQRRATEGPTRAQLSAFAVRTLAVGWVEFIGRGFLHISLRAAHVAEKINRRLHLRSDYLSTGASGAPTNLTASV